MKFYAPSLAEINRMLMDGRVAPNRPVPLPGILDDYVRGKIAHLRRGSTPANPSPITGAARPDWRDDEVKILIGRMKRFGYGPFRRRGGRQQEEPRGSRWRVPLNPRERARRLQALQESVYREAVAAAA